METKHRDIFYDRINRCYQCRFCGKWWDDNELEPDCMTGHEKAVLLLNSIKANLNERKTKPGSNR